MRILLGGLLVAPALVFAQGAPGGSGATTSLSARAALPEPAIPSSPDSAPGPTVSGPAGLLRMRTAEVGPTGGVRIGLHTEMFKKSGFLVAGDEHRRFIGTLVLAGTPFSWLEAFFMTTSSSNENSARRDEDDDVILALGDFGFGAKGRMGMGYFAAGPEANVRFLNSVGGTTPDLGATNFYLGAVASIDATAGGFPVRPHLNIGYQWDQSRELCGTDANGRCSSSEFEPVERMVEEFGQGINRDRFQMAIGLDWPLRLGRSFGLRPIVEYRIEIVTGLEDEAYFEECHRDGAAFSEICFLGRDSQVIVVGARAEPSRGLFIDFGVDLGVASPGADFGPAPAVPPYNVMLGLSYAHDPRGAVRVAERPRQAARVGPVGRVRGLVLDQATQEPVEGAVVTFTGKNVTGLSTDPDGGFLSYEFPPGPMKVAVRHPNYEPAKAEVSLRAGADVALEVRLKPAAGAPAPAAGRASLSGRVTDASGAPVRALLRVEGPVAREIGADDDGRFAADLPPGDYKARFEAADYLAKEQTFGIEEGAAVQLDAVLAKRPAVARVTISGDRIVIRGKVHFGSRNARLRPDSGQLLDELADLLLARPEIKRVRIEGHTDNRGNKSANQRLSQQRAEAVRTYLVERGVAFDRLDAVGHGASRPMVPNLGARNREKNRRVEMRIVD